MRGARCKGAPCYRVLCDRVGKLTYAFLCVLSEFSAISAVKSFLLLFPNLLCQIALVADFVDLMQLRLQPVHVLFFIFEQALEDLT